MALAVVAGAVAGLAVAGNAGLTAALAGLFAVGVAAGIATGVVAGCTVGTAGAGLAEAVDICSPLSKINADIDSDAAFRAARVGDRLKAAPAETD